MFVREFRRSDREQLTALVNRHVSSVLPGVALSTNVVMSQLEREPHELIIDPWVEHRRCLVVIEDEILVGATLLHRFGDDERVAEGYRSAADIRWLVVEPSAVDAGARMLQEAVAVAASWKPSHLYADGTLPAPACYGLSDTWPHVKRLLTDAGFAGPTRVEQVLAARCDRLVRPAVEGSVVRRRVGPLGVCFDLSIDGDEVGYIEVDMIAPALARSTSGTTWADVGNLWTADGADRGKVIPALYAAAADWLLLGGIDRLIDFHADDVHEPTHLDTLEQLGFQVMTTNERGWELALGR